MNTLNWDFPKLKKSTKHVITEVRKSKNGNYYFNINSDRFDYNTKLECMTARDIVARQHGKKQLYFPLDVKIPDNLNLKK